MPSRQRDNESLLLSGEALGDLSFDWAGDRYRHSWAFSGSPCKIESVESNSKQVWPVSPPLQQIHQQSFGDGRKVVFGVGMSGRGHWSASFTLVPELKSWIVELACRSAVEPVQLMSSYALSGDWQVDSDNQAQCDQPLASVTLEAISPGCHAQTEIAEAPADSHQMRFLPFKIADSNATTQWAFRLRVKSPG